MKVLDQTIDVPANARLLWVDYRALGWLLLLTALLDAASTIAFMSVLGPAREQNWMVRELSHTLGIFVGPPVGKVFQLLAVWALTILVPRLARLLCGVVILLNLVAVLVNLRVWLAGP